jgi:hypothetical protein
MTASEECGLVFLLICLSQFKVGWRLLNDALIHKGHKTDLSQVLEALEALSCLMLGLAWISIANCHNKKVLFASKGINGKNAEYDW